MIFDKLMISKEKALPGRLEKIPVVASHFLNSHPLTPPFPENMLFAMFGLGCFWGAEKIFWQSIGIYTTAVGYAAGHTPNPTYEEVCSGLTGHNEVVFMVYDPEQITYETLLISFWEMHDPTQGMRQGNDRGTQYRSGIYFYDERQKQLAEDSKTHYQKLLNSAGHAEITTEIIQAPEFFYAEDYHQQYLAKNPNGYCGIGGVGVGFLNDSKE